MLLLYRYVVWLGKLRMKVDTGDPSNLMKVVVFH